MTEKVIHYKDTVNKNIINKMKEDLNGLCINFNKLANPGSVANRESDLFEDYANQYKEDLITLGALRNFAQNIADQAIKSLYTISMRSLASHVFEDEFYNRED